VGEGGRQGKGLGGHRAQAILRRKLPTWRERRCTGETGCRKRMGLTDEVKRRRSEKKAYPGRRGCGRRKDAGRINVDCGRRQRKKLIE